MSKLTKEEFQAYLKQIRELAEGPLEEIQKEVDSFRDFLKSRKTNWKKADVHRSALRRKSMRNPVRSALPAKNRCRPANCGRITWFAAAGTIFE